MHAAAPPINPAARPSLDGARVLLVDDQPIIGEAVRRMLAEEAGIEFHYCQNPAEAIETAATIGPTVMLLDLVMPEIDGLELVRRFRSDERFRELPIIVLSTKEEPAVKAEAFTIGANDYIVKLPDRLELLARAKRMMPKVKTKSGLMLGLGETREELLDVFADLLDHGVDYLTLGQYLQPTADSLAVERYVPPEEFDELGDLARGMGFRKVASGPLVRSSYHARDMAEDGLVSG